MLKIKPDELQLIINYVSSLTGIVLDNSKAYLIESRLGPLAAELNCNSYRDLYYKSNNDPRRNIQTRIIDAITTNETLFFRDTSPFELLKHKIFPDVFDRIMAQGPGNKRLKIWSAACSTGQEVYSIAITLRELLADVDRWNIRLLGTDISDAAIAQASYGSFNQTEINRGLKPEQISKYFTANQTQYRIRDEVRAMTMFKKQNLHEPFVGMEKFDIVLCRNVAIYFSPENRKTLFERIANQLNPNGMLIIGASESLLGITDRFERKDYMRSVFYELKT